MNLPYHPLWMILLQIFLPMLSLPCLQLKMYLFINLIQCLTMGSLSVSYTHLDVYKRQVRILRQMNFWRMMFMVTNRNSVVLSLEHHLFFARMMKEHAIFLEVSFAGMNQHIAKEADQMCIRDSCCRTCKYD